MRIHTLGTSHGNSTFSRFNSSTAYETESGKIYLVDAGEPCEALMRRKGLSIASLEAVFITHMHEDHVGGVTGVIKQARKYAAKRQKPLAVYLPEKEAIEPLISWMYQMHEYVGEKAEYFAVTDGVFFEDEELKVTAIRTCHLRKGGVKGAEPVSFAYVLHFKKENIRVLHSGDLAPDFSDFPKIAENERFDVCVCEATHYKPETAMPILKKANFGRLIFNHVSDLWHLRIFAAWEFENGEKELLRECSELPYPVSIAHDGDEFLIY